MIALERINDMARRALCLLALCCSISQEHGAMAQSTGQLRFRFEPDKGMEYVLDGKHRLKDREQKLVEGPHRFVFFAPERRMLDTTITVVPDSTKEVLVRLRYSEEYLAYRDALGRYERGSKYGVVVPATLTAASAVWFTLSALKQRQTYMDLQDLEDSYATLSDPAAITLLKDEQIPAAQDDFKSARTQTYISGAVFAVSAATTYYLLRRSKTRTAPEFKDSERLRFEGLVWVPGTHGGTWAAGLTIPIR